MVRQPACDRARTWVSLRLDGELSELEGVLLDAHLERCDGCRAAAAAVVGVTNAIRLAPPEALPTPVAVPRARRRGSRRAFFGAAAATLTLVVVATSLGSLGAVRAIDRSAASPKLHRVSAVAGGVSDDLDLLAGVRVLRNERPIPGAFVWPA